MALKERIQEDMKAAMRAGEKERLATIRMLLAGIKQREVDERIQLDDAQVMSVLEKMIKSRKESVVQFEAGNRADLVARENAEIALLQTYLPAQLSDAEIDQLIAEAIAATGATLVPLRLTPETGFHLSATDLERAVTPQSRVLLLNSPSNPTGAVLSRDEILAIGEV